MIGTVIGELPDLRLLERLADHADELARDEAEAFLDMLGRFDRKLSPKQRQWAESVYAKRDIHKHYVENLVSKGRVKRTSKPHPLDAVMASRVLKPPTRL